MGNVRKRGRVNTNSAHEVAKRLPERLQSYDSWYFAPGGMPAGLQEYRRELVAVLAGVLGYQPPDGYVAQVQVAAAGPVSDWYRAVLAVS